MIQSSALRLYDSIDTERGSFSIHRRQKAGSSSSSSNYTNELKVFQCSTPCCAGRIHHRFSRVEFELYSTPLREDKRERRLSEAFLWNSHHMQRTSYCSIKSKNPSKNTSKIGSFLPEVFILLSATPPTSARLHRAVSKRRPCHEFYISPTQKSRGRGCDGFPSLLSQTSCYIFYISKCQNRL